MKFHTKLSVFIVSIVDPESLQAVKDAHPPRLFPTQFDVKTVKMISPRLPRVLTGACRWTAGGKREEEVGRSSAAPRFSVVSPR